MAASLRKPLVRGKSIERYVLAGGLAACAVWVTTSCSDKKSVSPGPSEPSAPAQPDVPIQMTMSPGQVAQGQAATLTVTWGTPLPGDTLVLVFSGETTGEATVPLTADAIGVQGTITVNASAPDGTINVSAYIHAVADSGATSLVVLDTQAPGIGNGNGDAWLLSVAPLPPMGLTSDGMPLVAGTTDSAQFMVTDNHALTWAGWALSAPAGLRDSVPVSGTDTSVSIPMPVPSALAGTVDSVEFFARDADGNVGQLSFGPASIAQYADHPVNKWAHADSVSDLAFDTKHSLLLVADPTNRQVDVLSMPSLTPKATVSLPHSPVSLDVTPGGDSALVLLDSTRSFAVINLASGYTVTTGQLPLIVDSASADTVSVGWRVRIAANDRAVIITRSLDTTETAVVEVNLANDSQRVVFPVTPRGSSIQPIARTPDGTLVIMPGIPYPATNYATTYTSTTQTYAASTVPYNTGAYPPLYSSVSNSPYYFLSFRQVMDASSVVFAYTGLPGLWFGTISPSASDVYIPASNCPATTGTCVDSAAVILHYRVPLDIPVSTPPFGQLLDVADAPEVPLVLAITPDGNTLIGVGATTLMAFDLTHSMAPSASRVRPPVVTALRKTIRAGRAAARAASTTAAKPRSLVTFRTGAFRYGSQH